MSFVISVIFRFEGTSEQAVDKALEIDRNVRSVYALEQAFNGDDDQVIEASYLGTFLTKGIKADAD